MHELSVCMTKRYFVQINTREPLISKSLLQKKMGKTKRQPTSIDFFSIYNLFTIFTIFFMIFEIVSKTSKKPIKGVFRAILLLQRERLKEMWWSKVEKPRDKLLL